jgi:hypothetical protein
MKIKISDVDKMIKEEFQKMMEKKKLSVRLSQINEELSKMDSEDTILNEVEAGGKTKVSSHAWTGKENGDEKFEPKFEKIGTHLKEDDMPGEGDDMPADIEGGMSNDTPEMEVEMGEFEAKFAEIGKAIDAKLAAEAGAGMGPVGSDVPAEGGEEMADDAGDSDEDFEEVEVEDKPEGEIEEYKEVVGGVGAEQGMTADDAVKKESVDEPLEGHSVVQDAPADTVNDNMEKDTHVKESAKKDGSVISEAKTPASKNIFTEGVDEKRKAALLSEMNRMKKFAGLSKDEE